MAVAAKLFELKRVSSGIAAAKAGCGRVSFLPLLHELGVPMIDLTAADIAEDAANA